MAVLITGATGGLGTEFSHSYAQRGSTLILVGRSDDKLSALQQELRARYGIAVHTITIDLIEPHAAQTVFKATQERGLRVDVLINNAGFGDYGPFITSNLEKQQNMVELNCKVLMELAHHFASGMVARGSGRIINVCSIASFQPGPLMSVYYATKAFALSLSEAMAEELRGTGVTVTALCPGPVKTGFEAAANLESSQLFQNLTVAEPHDVVHSAVAAADKGRAICIPGIKNKLTIFGERLMPRFAVRRFVHAIQAARR